MDKENSNNCNHDAEDALVITDLNRTFADSVFRKYFNNEERLKSLYSGLTGKPYEEIDEIKIATLENVIFGNMKNDLAFIINNVAIAFIEHQSEVNKNMPVRMLCYAGETLWKLLNNKDIHRGSLKKIPAPRFYVLYNGTDNWPNERNEIMKLSDAFLEESCDDCSIELKVKIININYDRHDPLLDVCEYINQYAQFIDAVRYNRSQMDDDDRAMAKAIEDCISHGVMADFLKKYGEEVQNMFTYQLSLEEEIQFRAEGLAEYRAEIMAEKMAEERAEKMAEERAEKMVEERAEKLAEERAEKLVEERTNEALKQCLKRFKEEGIPLDTISKCTGLPLQLIESI